MIYVFDANAVIALANDEAGAELVESYLADPANTCFIHAINLCEAFYDALRRGPLDDAIEAINELYDLGVTPRQDMDESFWQEAGKFKAAHRRVSLADCFAIALTLRMSGTLVTSDHHELDPIAAAGVCPILFFR